MNNFLSWLKGEADFIAEAGERLADKPDSVKKAKCPHSYKGGGIKAANILIVLVLAVFLITISVTLPVFGTGVTTQNELSQRYIESGVTEVGAVNLVANMILVYRGFDTFGESTVLFAAAACVIMLLGRDSKNYTEADRALEKREDFYISIEHADVLHTVSLGLIPFIFIFAVYILLNGHLSPGGGFSGGAVMGAALILCDVALGRDRVGSFFNHKVYNIIKVGALCIYAAILLWIILLGSNGLSTHMSPGTPGMILSAGPILPINVMVGFEVACTMYAFYAYFGRGELE